MAEERVTLAGLENDVVDSIQEWIEDNLDTSDVQKWENWDEYDEALRERIESMYVDEIFYEVVDSAVSTLSDSDLLELASDSTWLACREPDNYMESFGALGIISQNVYELLVQHCYDELESIIDDVVCEVEYEWKDSHWYIIYINTVNVRWTITRSFVLPGMCWLQGDLFTRQLTDVQVTQLIKWARDEGCFGVQVRLAWL